MCHGTLARLALSALLLDLFPLPCCFSIHNLLFQDTYYVIFMILIFVPLCCTRCISDMHFVYTAPSQT